MILKVKSYNTLLSVTVPPQYEPSKSDLHKYMVKIHRGCQLALIIMEPTAI